MKQAIKVPLCPRCNQKVDQVSFDNKCNLLILGHQKVDQDFIPAYYKDNHLFNEQEANQSGLKELYKKLKRG